MLWLVSHILNRGVAKNLLSNVEDPKKIYEDNCLKEDAYEQRISDLAKEEDCLDQEIEDIQLAMSNFSKEDSFKRCDINFCFEFQLLKLDC